MAINTSVHTLPCADAYCRYVTALHQPWTHSLPPSFPPCQCQCHLSEGPVGHAVLEGGEGDAEEDEGEVGGGEVEDEDVGGVAHGGVEGEDRDHQRVTHQPQQDDQREQHRDHPLKTTPHIREKVLIYWKHWIG